MYVTKTGHEVKENVLFVDFVVLAHHPLDDQALGSAQGKLIFFQVPFSFDPIGMNNSDQVMLTKNQPNSINVLMTWDLLTL